MGFIKINLGGVESFRYCLFPYVLNIIRQQTGFVDIVACTDNNEPDCINITLKFADSETFMHWVNHDLHQQVIADLDCYRTQKQLWFIRENDDRPPPLNLQEWESQLN